VGNKRPPNISYKGRSLGIIVLTTAQLLIGAIHLAFGLILLTAEILTTQATIAYDVYTIIFGLLVLIFAFLIWQGKRAGWIGTVAVSVFVIVVDILALLNLPSINGIPKFAAPTEIGYSVLIIIYLSLNRVRKKFFA
jgi:hypothetical protein